MRHTSHWDRTKYLYTCVYDSATCVVGYMCGWLHVWLATCVVSYMCSRLHVWSATCAVGYMCGQLHVQSATCVVSYMCGYDLLTTEVSFMRGYTGDESGMDGYRYRTWIAILNQQLDND